jgi:uncharacterized protein DUF3224
MTRTTLVPLSALAAFAAAALISAPVGVAQKAHTSATSHQVDMRTTKFCSPYPACSYGDGVNAKAVYNGRPFGKCPATTKLAIPKVTGRWKCKGGSFTVVSTNTSGAADKITGNWHVVRGSGTGKYKGITGKGKIGGRISTGIFTFKGSAKY